MATGETATCEAKATWLCTGTARPGVMRVSRCQRTSPAHLHLHAQPRTHRPQRHLLGCRVKTGPGPSRVAQDEPPFHLNSSLLRQIPPSGGRVRVADAAGGYPEHPPTPITPITPQRVATNPGKPHESVSGHTWPRRRSVLREREDTGWERVSFCRPFEFNWDHRGERGTGGGGVWLPPPLGL